MYYLADNKIVYPRSRSLTGSTWAGAGKVEYRWRRRRRFTSGPLSRPDPTRPSLSWYRYRRNSLQWPARRSTRTARIVVRTRNSRPPLILFEGTESIQWNIFKFFEHLLVSDFLKIYLCVEIFNILMALKILTIFYHDFGSYTFIFPLKFYKQSLLNNALLNNT